MDVLVGMVGSPRHTHSRRKIPAGGRAGREGERTRTIENNGERAIKSERKRE